MGWPLQRLSFIRHESSVWESPRLSSLKNPVRARIKRRRPKDSVSKLAFRVSYLRRSREIYRRYLESKPWLNQLYTSFLNLRPGQKIVDIGCGPGDFTRQLARLSNQKAKIRSEEHTSELQSLTNLV